MNPLYELIGLLAAGLTTLSFLPQVIQVVRTRETRGISLVMYLAFIAGVLCWLTYGLLIGNPPIIIANTITFLLAAIVLGYKLRWG